MSTSTIVPFTFHGNEVRVVEIDGVPHFVGKDVCDVLGYTNHNKAIGDHCRGVRNLYPLRTDGGIQNIRVLCESDVIRLIVRSHLPAAVAFERWVFEDVLPAIRRTGRYAAPEHKVPTTLPEALRLAADALEENGQLKQVIAEQEPHVAALAIISASDQLWNLTSAAKHFDMPPKKFVERLHEKCWVYRRTPGGPLYAHQDKVRSGLLTEKITFTTRDAEGNEKARSQVMLTGKGIAAIAKAIARAERTAAREIEACAARLAGNQ